MKDLSLLVLCGVALTALASATAIAQQREGIATQQDQIEARRNQTVATRSRPDFDAQGAPLGAFRLNLNATGELRYDDNIFRRENDAVDDYIAAILPSGALFSNWSRHSLRLLANADVARYDKYETEDYEDWTVAGDGRLDISRTPFAAARLAANQLHEDRGSPDAAGGFRPTTYMLYEGDLEAEYKPSRFGGRLTWESNRFRYDDTLSSTGIINQQDRNRDEFYLAATGSYQIQPQYDAFIRLGANQRSYRQVPDDDGFNRDSDGWVVVGGARLDYTGILFGDVFAGWMKQTYDDPRFSTVDGPQVGTTLFWNPTGLTSVDFRVSRAIQETTLADASGFWSTTLGAGVDHELRRNILLNGDLTFANNDYNGISREDDLLRFGIGGSYLFNRHWRASASYSFNRRDSNVAGSSYKKNLLILRLTAQL